MAVTRASELIRAWLRDHTQQELADVISERVGRPIAQSTISAIKRGEATPRGDIMSALHAELCIDIGWWSEMAVSAADESGEHSAVHDASRSTG